MNKIRGKKIKIPGMGTIVSISMQKIAYLEIIYAFEILHASPHDPDFVGHHLTIFVKNAHHVWLLDEPKWVLEGTTSLGKKTALRSNYKPYFENLPLKTGLFKTNHLEGPSFIFLQLQKLEIESFKIYRI